MLEGKPMPKGYLAFLLHAHLPFVRHPEYDQFLEERWFFEAMSETYIPLLRMFDRLARENIPSPLTVSLSPTLLAMMEDPLLQARYRAHLARLIDLAGRELNRLAGEPHISRLAAMYRERFEDALALFDHCGGRLSQLFKQFRDRGVIEIITTAATHGILPLLSPQPKAVAAQVGIGLDYFESVLGFRPDGLWLPECAWTQGLGPVLRQEGIRYFFLESHGIENASINPFHGVYAPIYTPEGVAAFGRDRETTKEVWSAEEGFPGDPDYREFYRDIGHDLDMETIREFICGGIRCDTGIKYHRITGPTSHKHFYNPDAAREKAALHAAAFVERRVSHIEYLHSVMEAPPIVVAPFDAELFGHWWFEGPLWLEYVIRKAAFDQDVFQFITPGGYLDRHPVHQVAEPASSSWGRAGTLETWLNTKTEWIYGHLIEGTRRMEELVLRYGSGEVPPLLDRALRQCLRELLQAQGSDWPFIITNGTAEGYATRRLRDHISRFHALADAIASARIDEETLSAMEALNPIFPQADWRRFQPDAHRS